MRVLLTLALVGLAASAVAQQPASPSVRPDPVADQDAGGLKPGQRYEPGWRVGVVPKVGKGQPAETVGIFIAKPGGFTFGDFRKTVAHPGWASFQGGAWFNAGEAARYVFVNRITWEPGPQSAPVQCQFRTTAAGQDVILPENATLNAFENQAVDRLFQGGVDLPKDAQQIQFTVSCALMDYGANASDEQFTQNPRQKAWFDSIRFTFGVRGPNDMSVQPPAEDELVHIVAAKPLRAAPRK